MQNGVSFYDLTHSSIVISRFEHFEVFRWFLFTFVQTLLCIDIV